jgi:hypothetical protein
MRTRRLLLLAALMLAPLAAACDTGPTSPLKGGKQSSTEVISRKEQNPWN